MTHAHTGPPWGSVPVLRLGDVLLVTLQGDLHDSTAEQLQQDISETIASSSTTGVVIDLSGVEMVDSFLGRVLAEIAAKAGLSPRRPWWPACGPRSRSRWWNWV